MKDVQNAVECPEGIIISIVMNVPILNMTIPFEENNQRDIEECFKAIKSLTEVANVLALSSEMAGL